MLRHIVLILLSVAVLLNATVTHIHGRQIRDLDHRPITVVCECGRDRNHERDIRRLLARVETLEAQNETLEAKNDSLRLALVNTEDGAR